MAGGPDDAVKRAIVAFELNNNYLDIEQQHVMGAVFGVAMYRALMGIGYETVANVGIFVVAGACFRAGRCRQRSAGRRGLCDGNLRRTFRATGHRRLCGDLCAGAALEALITTNDVE